MITILNKLYWRLYQWIIRRDCNRTYREKHPIAYWPLDDPPGGVARDISGNGHDGHLCEAMPDEGHIDGIIFSFKKDGNPK